MGKRCKTRAPILTQRGSPACGSRNHPQPLPGAPPAELQLPPPDLGLPSRSPFYSEEASADFRPKECPNSNHKPVQPS